MPSVGAARIAGGRLFQRRGTTAEKALFRVLSFRASLGFRLLSLTSRLVRVIRIDLGGSRHSAKYGGPKLRSLSSVILLKVTRSFFAVLGKLFVCLFVCLFNLYAVHTTQRSLGGLQHVKYNKI